MKPGLVCAVDVGTRSARAGIFTAAGDLLGRAEHPISVFLGPAGEGEHDSEEIWAAVSAAVRAALRLAGASPGDVAGISFDATCSLVALDRTGAPLSVSASGLANRDTIAWFDHRAGAEAAQCTATGHRVLDHVGGVMSPEMATPKLAWLKRHMPRTWERLGYVFDLTDYLTFRASASPARSQGTLAAKWTYLAHEPAGWCHDYLAAVGLADLIEKAGLPARATVVGNDLGPLTPRAARDLGLTRACRVGTGMIDAHAGTLGLLGGHVDDPGIAHQFALVAGTSSCIAFLSPVPRGGPGVWGPYLGAALPGHWLGEAGQSATGALLDHVIRLHSAGGEPDRMMHRRIGTRIDELRAREGAAFARRLHVLPDFHGNRFPHADPDALGVVSGLTMDASFDDLCRLYYRTAVAIALGVRQILDVLEARGVRADRLHLAGGHARSPLLRELYADATGRPLVIAEGDGVLAGTAMAAATAAGLHPDLARAATAMARPGRERRPDPVAARQLDRDYAVFLRMQDHRREIDARLRAAEAEDDSEAASAKAASRA
ncbi:FGGY-family carbohydrate kinase [Methylobrevis pamukkalensis]|uniref:Ribulokinase n=1 Tax=Methylobrevis pamukkalensis TaxID=1439726 RepID=A0A1E3H6K5_9HYPH|nr:FGGY-family carbohydrate kinase [Methylobrevis pamukkalensis]ODN71969.1 Ribulokinase [Methylobrevis pamukkalensis]